MVSAGYGALSRGFMTALPSLSFDSNALDLATSLSLFAGKIRSFREPLQKAVRDVVIPSIRQNFDAGGRPAWKPLSEATLSIRDGNTILVRTGALRQGATQQNNWKYTTTEAVMEGLPSRVWYGMIHQLGGTGIPPRPFAMIQPQDEAAIDKVFNDWLEERLGEF